ncbi:MAG: transaldolase [Acidobacteria bacterium]|nr:MAG: transaldolase [Acidobacteriota bacterium]
MHKMINRRKTRILLDSGDPDETVRIRGLLGYLDGQTTNPPLIASNPHVVKYLASGRRFTSHQESEEYRSIVQGISRFVGSAGVSIEVFADSTTSAEHMFEQGREMYAWIDNAYIKYPCTAEGIQAAQMSVASGMRVNMTLCYSQAQAAAVYSATKGTASPVYVSPFIGHLDGIGKPGIDLVKNIQRMFLQGDGHVLLLAASIRSLEHLVHCLSIDVDMITVPSSLLSQWAIASFPVVGPPIMHAWAGDSIPYETLDLEQPWELFDLSHALTTQGIERFAHDYEQALAPAS